MLICVFISLVPLCFKEQNAVIIWIDRITTILFIADYILRWSVADHKFTKSGKVAFFIYPFTAFALLDLIAILPFFLDISSGFKMVKLFRVFKTAKVLRILKYSKNFDRLVKVIRKEYKGTSKNRFEKGKWGECAECDESLLVRLYALRGGATRCCRAK